MSDAVHRHCPVCRRHVSETPKQQIAGHYDTRHNACSASFEPFWITTVVDYKPTHHEYAQLFDEVEALQRRLGVLERTIKKLRAR